MQKFLVTLTPFWLRNRGGATQSRRSQLGKEERKRKSKKNSEGMKRETIMPAFVKKSAIMKARRTEELIKETETGPRNRFFYFILPSSILSCASSLENHFSSKNIMNAIILPLLASTHIHSRPLTTIWLNNK